MRILVGASKLFLYRTCFALLRRLGQAVILHLEYVKEFRKDAMALSFPLEGRLSLRAVALGRKIIFSPDRMPAASEPQPCTACLVPQNSTV